MAKQTILVRITTPEEGYGDVHPELILADFFQQPEGFEAEIMKESQQDEKE